MARPAADGGDLRVLIVEDRVSHANTLAAAVRRAGSGNASVDVVGVTDHVGILREDPGDPLTRFRLVPEVVAAAPDVVLIDAMRHPHDVERLPGALPFAGLPIAQCISEALPGCRSIGYSSMARRPRVAIPFHQVPGVVAVYDHASLIDNVAEALWSADPTHCEPAPDDDDFAALGLAPGAAVWEALRFVMRRRDTWEAVARVHGYLGLENRTRAHLNKYLPELMPMPGATSYRPYVELLRTVAGFA